jgi:tetratricopeptide (TPR) repeat protein
VPKQKKSRRPRPRSSVWLAVAVILVSAVIGLTWWKKTGAKKIISLSASSAPENAPPRTGPVASNAFDMAKFSGWLTNESNLDDLLGSGSRLLGEGRAGLAFLCFSRVTELKPEHEEAWFNLGAALVRLGELPEAEYAYLRAISNFTEYAEARNNLGNLLTRQKRYAEAAEQFNAVIAQSPDNAAAHNNLGRALADQGNTLAALERFTEAARLDTNYLEARYNLGAAHLTMGQTNEAVAAFRETLRLRPDFQPALQALAKLRKQP